MKKKWLAAALAAACMMTAVPAYTVMADGQKVVTLGADLSEEQKNAILRYFGVAGQNIQTLTITNTDERNHLGAYVPLEQIGTRTFSCALVSPTHSGGIQVKTANLNWVTSNMIATTLSTSGVVNCDVLAAAPFEVSGTGALTGILMAYESASGTTLDTEKKEVATQELITTTTLADSMGPVNATEIVNEIKIQVIEGNVIDDDDITVIIDEVADEQEVELSDIDHAMLEDLMKRIAEQGYEYEKMRETLERVDTNLDELVKKDQTPQVVVAETPQTPETEAPVQPQTELSADSILMNTDDSALGESVVFDATDSAALTEETETIINIPEEPAIEITSSDSYTDQPQNNEVTDIPAEDPAQSVDIPAEDPAQTIDIPAEDPAQSVDIPAEDPAQEVIDIPVEDPAQSIEIPQTEPAAAPAITAEDLVFAPITSDKNDYMAFAAGINELTIYSRRDDVTGAAGTISIINNTTGETETIFMNDSSKVQIRAMTAEELIEQGIEAGNKITIYPSVPFAQNTYYTINLSADALMSLDGMAHMEELAGIWGIQTSEFGLVVDKKASNGGIYAGDTVSAQIMMDGTAAAYAAIENADASLVFDQTEFDTFGPCNITFTASGKIPFSVSFYAEDGSLLGSIDYIVTVQ